MAKKKTNKMPAILFYTGDWLKDPAVRCCSLEARGLWIEMLCLMYESPKRGYLSLANGEAVSDVQLSRMVGASPEDVKRLTSELRACGVFSDTDDGIVFSRRMVSDELQRADKSRAGKKGMKSRYNKSDNRTSNRTDNKVVTRLEYEYEDESVIDSSSKYIQSKRSREIGNQDVQIVLDAIPKNKLDNPVETKYQIERVLDVATEQGSDRTQAARLLAERFALYYKSKQGTGAYFKSPHNWLAQNCHLAHPSSWDSRKEETNWDTATKEKQQ